MNRTLLALSLALCAAADASAACGAAELAAIGARVAAAVESAPRLDFADAHYTTGDRSESSESEARSLAEGRCERKLAGLKTGGDAAVSFCTAPRKRFNGWNYAVRSQSVASWQYFYFVSDIKSLPREQAEAFCAEGLRCLRDSVGEPSLASEEARAGLVEKLRLLRCLPR